MQNQVFQEIQSVEGNQEHIWCVAWNLSGQLLASCGADRCITIWELNDGLKLEKRQILDSIHSRTIRSVCFSPSGKFLASGSFDSTVGVWILSDGKFKHIQTLEGHENEIKSVAWSHDEKYLASCSRDKTIWIWDHDDDLEFQCNSVLSGHTQDVKFIKWVPQTYNFLSCGYDDTIRIWIQEDEDWQSNLVLNHEGTVWGVDVSGDLMVSVSDDLKINVWRQYSEDDDSKSLGYKLIQSLVGHHTESIYSCSLNERYLITGSGDNTICVFLRSQVEDQPFTLIGKIESHTQDVNCVALHPSKPIFVSCGDDQLIKLFKLVL